jgi:hypothetical protein
MGPQMVGITDRRFDPNHSWRHAGKPGIDRETRDALTGHSDDSVSRDYGEFGTAFYRAIIRLVNSLDKTPVEGGTGQ